MLKINNLRKRKRALCRRNIKLKTFSQFKGLKTVTFDPQNRRQNNNM